MRPCRRLLIPALLTTVLVSIAAADTPEPAPANQFTLTLRFGTETATNQDVLQPVYAKAVELLESSNFNSHAPRWSWNVSEVLEGYRKTVSGKYLLVSFREPRKLKTLGGEVIVREIVIGLNRPDLASSLYTIDDEERIVAHTKYSGPLCVEFLKLVKRVAGEA